MRAKKRFAVYVKRNNAEKWTAWAEADDLPKAEKHYNRALRLDYIAKIVDREGTK